VQLLYRAYIGTFTLFSPFWSISFTKGSKEQMNEEEDFPQSQKVYCCEIRWYSVHIVSFSYLTGLVELLCQVSFYDRYLFTQLVFRLLLICLCCHVHDVGLQFDDSVFRIKSND
jgi:hypothetical protein